MNNPTRMSAGSQTGSFINHIISGSQSPAPVLGMGGTILGWTDRQAATVVSIAKDGKSLLTRDDIAIRTDKNGMSESQSYDFQQDDNGIERQWKLAKDGSWRSAEISPKGRVVFTDGGQGKRLVLGKRDHYYDFSF